MNIASGVRPLAGLSILIMEDEAAIARLLEEILEDGGCNDVTLVPNIGAALPPIQQRVFSGVLLDMNLSDVSSIAVAEELVGRSIPFALVTGYGVQNSDPLVIKAGPRLQKPFAKDALLRIVMEVFANGALPQERHQPKSGG
jgi:DNA-binding NtrC family response regulator